MDISWHYIHSKGTRHGMKQHPSNYKWYACHILPWLGGGGENLVRGVKISYDIFTRGWEYRGVKILYHTGSEKLASWQQSVFSEEFESLYMERQSFYWNRPLLENQSLQQLILSHTNLEHDKLLKSLAPHYSDQRLLGARNFHQEKLHIQWINGYLFPIT